MASSCVGAGLPGRRAPTVVPGTGTRREPYWIAAGAGARVGAHRTREVRRGRWLHHPGRPARSAAGDARRPSGRTRREPPPVAARRPRAAARRGRHRRPDRRRAVGPNRSRRAPSTSCRPTCRRGARRSSRPRRRSTRGCSRPSVPATGCTCHRARVRPAPVHRARRAGAAGSALGRHGAAAAVLGSGARPVARAAAGRPRRRAVPRRRPARHLADRRLDVRRGLGRRPSCGRAEPRTSTRSSPRWSARRRTSRGASASPSSRCGRCPARAGSSRRSTLYAATRRSLADELGVDPGPALRAMHQRVLRQDPELRHRLRRVAVGTSSAAGLVRRPRPRGRRGPGAAGVAPAGHPHRSRRFRQDPAGAGGREPSDGGRRRVVVVELAGLQDASQVAAAIAAQIGLSAVDPLAALLTVLSQRAGAAGPGQPRAPARRRRHVARLLRRHRPRCGCSRPRARRWGSGPSSRSRVPPLAVPGARTSTTSRCSRRSDACGCSPTGRARVDPTFAVTADNAADLAAVVRRLDGLPLALEIVGPVAAAADPDGAARPAGPRRSTSRPAPTSRPGTGACARRSRGATTCSTPSQQRLLARLSVFRGDSGLDAVEAVCGRGRARRSSTCWSTWSTATWCSWRRRSTGRPRFRLLRTVRDFAAERLDASGERRGGRGAARRAGTPPGPPGSPRTARARTRTTGWPRRSPRPTTCAPPSTTSRGARADGGPAAARRRRDGAVVRGGPRARGGASGSTRRSAAAAPGAPARRDRAWPTSPGCAGRTTGREAARLRAGGGGTGAGGRRPPGRGVRAADARRQRGRPRRGGGRHRCRAIEVAGSRRGPRRPLRADARRTRSACGAALQPGRAAGRTGRCRRRWSGSGRPSSWPSARATGASPP